MKEKNKSMNIIEQINKIKFVGSGGIRFGTALGSYWFVHSLWDRNSMEKLSDFFFFVSDYSVKISKNPKICFLYTSANPGRRDLENMFGNVVGLAEDKMELCSMPEAKEADLSYCWLLPIWYIQLGGLKLTTMQKKLIVMRMYHCFAEAKRIFKIIKKYKKQIKLTVVFGDMYPVDNIVVQLCKKEGIFTASLQHGISNGSYHYIEYRCSEADYLLAWGKYTYDMAVKFGVPKEKIKVLGALTSINRKQEKYQTLDKKVFGVLTRNVFGKKYVDDNAELLYMANQFARTFHYRYILRKHPGDANRYIEYTDPEICIELSDAGKKEDTLESFLKKVDFVICSNSTTFADALSAGKMAFRYIPEREAAEDVCRGIAFGKVASYEELEKAFIEYYKGSDAQIDKVSAYIYEPGDVAENYRNFFDREI